MKIETILASKGTNVFTVRPDRSIKEAIALLVQHNIGALIVVDDSGKPIGILSERDIIREAARNDAVLGQPVSQVMTQNVIAASPHDDITSVEQAMTYRRIRHVPVMDQGQLISIVSIGDVVKAQLDQYEGQIETLHTQLNEG